MYSSNCTLSDSQTVLFVGEGTPRRSPTNTSGSTFLPWHLPPDRSSLCTTMCVAGNLPEWRYYASDGCADGAEATMANANALVDLPALRSVSTGFFAEPTSTQGSDTDGSQLRLCGQKGFLFNGAFGDLCNSPNFSPGGICLKIPATADLFGGGQSATGGYWAK